VFVGNASVGDIHDRDHVDDRTDRGQFARGLVAGDDRSVERSPRGVDDVLRRRVSQRFRNRWSPVAA